jgi:hypothetical protein
MLDLLPVVPMKIVIDHLLCSRDCGRPLSGVAVHLSTLRRVNRAVRDSVDLYRDNLRKRLYEWCVENGAALGLPIHLVQDMDRSLSVSVFGLTCHALHPKQPAQVFPPSLLLHTFCDSGALDSNFMMVFHSPNNDPNFYCKVYVSGSIFRLETHRNTPIALLVRCPREWWDRRDYGSILNRY